MKKSSGFGRMLVVGWLATAAACSGGAPTPSAPPAATRTLDTPAGTAVVARIGVGLYDTFHWSPDGRYLLIGNQNGSSIYDRRGRLLSQFHGSVGWIDASHVLAPDGIVRPVTESQGLGEMANQWVVANGHGTAMVVVAVPGCTGDPLVSWYRDGTFHKETQEKLTPFGFSPDGDLALEGHLTCSGMDAELHGWKGDVDVVQLPNGRTISMLHGIRGPIAFDPFGKSVAAQSDADLVVATDGESQVSTLKNARMLAWSDEVTMALWGSPSSMVDTNGPPVTKEIPDGEVGLRSPATDSPSGQAPALEVTFRGDVIGVDAATNRYPNARLIDLTAENLAIMANPEPGPNARAETSLQPRYWSPDGRMLALPTADGTSIVLVSVDPSKPGTPYETKPPRPSS